MLSLWYRYIPWRTEVPPFNVELKHSERWTFRDKDTKEIVRTHKQRDAYYHTRNECILKRFPYFNKSYLQISAAQRALLNNAHASYLNEEFSIDFIVKRYTILINYY